VALADGVMTDPMAIGDELVAQLRAAFTDAQLVELTLKVMKFNVQKVMVALGTDAAITVDTIGALRWNQNGEWSLARSSTDSSRRLWPSG
jgi:hypothetical protein